MTGEEWDIAYWRIYDDLVRDGASDDGARHLAAEECTEQFGPRQDDPAGTPNQDVER